MKRFSAALTQWSGFDPAGYRAYAHFKNARQLGQETMAAHCREIAAQFGSSHVGMNSNYFAADSKSIDFVTIFGIAALVLAAACSCSPKAPMGLIMGCP